MATKKKARFTAKVDLDKRMKDYYFAITDKSNKTEIIRKTGYKSRGTAKRGYDRISKSLFQASNIEFVS